MATGESGPARGWDNPLWERRWKIIASIATAIGVLITMVTCVSNLEEETAGAPPLVTDSPSLRPEAVVTTGLSEDTATPSALPTETDIPVLLADLEPVGGDSWGTEEVKGVEISGQSYPQSVVEFCQTGGSDLEYNLGRRWRIFKATIGIDDTQPASDFLVDVAVYGDNELLKSTTIVLGQPEEVEIPVQDVLRLRLSCQGRNKDPLGGADTFLSYGNATLIP